MTETETVIHLRLDTDKLTLWDMEIWEGDSEKRWTWTVDILSRMAVDEYGVPLPYEDAKRAIRKLTLTESRSYLNQLLESANVPKASE